MTIYLGSGLCLFMLVIKSSLIYEAYVRLIKSSLLSFFIPLYLMNLVELTMYFDATQSLFVLKLYYICAMASICGALYISLRITNSGMLLWGGYIFLAILVSTMSLFSNSIINDYVPFLLTITAVRGDYYYVWQGAAILGLIAILTVLIDGMRSYRPRKIKANSSAFLVSILAPMLLGFSIVVLMSMGYKVNATVWLPVSTTIFMLLARFLITEQYTIDVRYIFRKDVLLAIRRLLISGTNITHSLKEDLKAYEHILVNNSLKDNNNDLKTTANQLKISETSIRRKRNEFSK